MGKASYTIVADTLPRYSVPRRRAAEARVELVLQQGEIPTTNGVALVGGGARADLPIPPAVQGVPQPH